MKLVWFSPRALVALLLVLVGVASCFAEPKGTKAVGSGGSGGSGPITEAGVPASGGAAGEAALPACYARPVVASADCHPVKSHEPLRGRVIEGVAHEQQVFVDDLFNTFKSHCGGCHVSNSLGNLQVNRTTFPQLVDRNVLSAIHSDTETCELDKDGKKVDKDCYDFMPPKNAFGKPWSERMNDSGDAVLRFATLLEAWLDAGSPRDEFTLPADLSGPAPYTVDEAMADSLTNLGTCIPDPELVATEYDKSCQLDAMFALAERKSEGSPQEKIGLPERLDQTDLFTFDSKELARHGVIGYSPAYPLWTDDAGKQRYVRVPHGYDKDGKPLSIRFNPDTQQFEIPDNTRFYKTFWRKIKTLDGSDRWRKVETRLIVARANNQALFGTYLWNQDETDATLHVEPLRNGEPFADRLLTVVLDEPKEAEIHARFDAGEFGKYANLTYQLDKEHVLRRYAIPGSNRCIQCHQGSASQSFILGFSPLQANHRKCDEETLQANGHCEGGILNAVDEDELSQLKRLIDYGIITNYDPVKDLIRLEDPQGKRGHRRPMRSEYELAAQAYMLANCSHCHNPNGYATNQNPELRDLLNFLPSDVGGIFQFPLERYSPRIKRGLLGTTEIPYITPYLSDLTSSNTGWTPKVVGVIDPNGGELKNVPIPAPWRSLIYRNVDTPFTYTDDDAIYPHMPLNTPGYDCRVARILGQWMVSIPALPKMYGGDPGGGEMQAVVEVKEGDDKYLNALDQSQKSLKAFNEGQRGKWCPDTSDIIDINVLRGRTQIPHDHEVDGAPVESVPERPHYVLTDLTDPPPPWNPRRGDWDKVIKDGGMVPPLSEIDSKDPIRVAARQDQVEAVGIGRFANITADFEKFATTKLPFALWEPNEKCKFPDAPTLGSFKGGDRPRWMDKATGSADSPVYETLPGAAVFNMICVNCHGTEADSGGRQASTLQEMTGGNGRVANFRDGLFGPFGKHGENRISIFGVGGKTDDEKAELGQHWASHYLAWMALGGTSTIIPDPILKLVAKTPVAGESRPYGIRVSTANMLQVAQKLCRDVALLSTNSGEGQKTFNPATLGGGSRDDLYAQASLILKNGDAELWQRLCTFNNIAPVHVIQVQGDKLYSFPTELYCAQPSQFQSNRYKCTVGYPESTPIGNQFGVIDASLTQDNYFPWCVKATTAEEKAVAKTFKTADGKDVPLCPESFVSDENRFVTEFNGGSIYHGVNDWAARGAINAGFAVFMYLRDFIGNGTGRAFRYNECEPYEASLGMTK